MWPGMPPADYGASVVFRGTVTEKKVLPARAEIKGRGRYETTFRVDTYWKGSQQAKIVIYGVDSGTDCLGGSGYEVGKNYLVFATDFRKNFPGIGSATFWYVWTEILPKGEPMLMVTICTPGGDTSKDSARYALDRLDKESHPANAKSPEPAKGTGVH
jgi:hypothetical protein